MLLCILFCLSTTAICGSWRMIHIKVIAIIVNNDGEDGRSSRKDHRLQKKNQDDHSGNIWSGSNAESMSVRCVGLLSAHHKPFRRTLLAVVTPTAQQTGYALSISLNRLSHIRLITIFHCLCLHLWFQLLTWSKCIVLLLRYSKHVHDFYRTIKTRWKKELWCAESARRATETHTAAHQ